MNIDQELVSSLISQANASDRFRASFDLRTTVNDSSQQILNALLPGTQVPIHRHPNSNEYVIVVCGSLDEVIYEEYEEFDRLVDDPCMMDDQDIVKVSKIKEVERIHLDPKEGIYGCTVRKGTWHTVEVFEPSVIYEGKDGKYGEDGSETYIV